ncbi:Alcohol dehydrogenase [Hondaea fermentalgiana]|uniref:Alcohol dehydrogenase n=1 Tax=Hondaea fermentalgiana TaxID=2315210 RepID=A0A2R5GJV6_9STRA|nr:Alcohol dehydrogenase [Hondaea fermentalgiana]|eukprot:GBG28561.1 Alcohol dehydrogenase [Hondaea fermentalgiana]
MRAVTFQQPLQVAVEEVAIPEISDPRAVVVKTQLAALCGSDLHIYRGAEAGLDVGAIQGHEFVGHVHAVGDEVTSLKVGDAVMSPFTTSCGECFFCVQNMSARCTAGGLFGWRQDGGGLHGGQAEYVLVPMAETTLIKRPENVKPEHALLMGDILATAFYCAIRGDVGTPWTPDVLSESGAGPCESHGESDVVVVVGCGPVGLLTVACAVYLSQGKSKVVAIDCVPERLEAAKRMGAAKSVNFKMEDAAAVVRELSSSKRGARVVLEVVGQRSAMQLAYACVQPGGTLSSVGVHAYEPNAITPDEFYDKNLTFRSGRCPVRSLLVGGAMPHLRAILEATPEADALFTHRIGFADAADAYKKFNAAEDGMIKCLIDPTL